MLTPKISNRYVTDYFITVSISFHLVFGAQLLLNIFWLFGQVIMVVIFKLLVGSQLPGLVVWFTVSCH